MKSLKFVMITTFYPPYHLGGDALHVYYLSNELAKLGHEVHVVYSIDAYYLNRKKKPSGVYANHDGVFLYPLKSRLKTISPLICGFGGLSYPLASKAKELIQIISPDVIHHHNIAAFGPAVLDARAPKVLYTAHDYWLICPRNNLLRPNGTFCDGTGNCFTCSLQWKRPPQLWRYFGILDRNLSYVDKIIAPSEYMRSVLKKSGIPRPIVTIPNFVPEPNGVGEPVYRFPYFLFVGVLEEHKGILNLVEIFSQEEDEINAKLLIVGSGSLDDELKRIIIQNGCEDKIKLLGKVNQKVLTNLYSNALALVVPSTWPENAPLVALEAIACDTPVIASNEGGLPEIATKVDHGLVFGDKGNLKDILVRTSKGLENTLCRPRNVYEEFYSPRIFLSRYFSQISSTEQIRTMPSENEV